MLHFSTEQYHTPICQWFYVHPVSVFPSLHRLVPQYLSYLVFCSKQRSYYITYNFFCWMTLEHIQPLNHNPGSQPLRNRNPQPKPNLNISAKHTQKIGKTRKNHQGLFSFQMAYFFWGSIPKKLPKQLLESCFPPKTATHPFAVHMVLCNSRMLQLKWQWDAFYLLSLPLLSKSSGPKSPNDVIFSMDFLSHRQSLHMVFRIRLSRLQGPQCFIKIGINNQIKTHVVWTQTPFLERNFL